MSPSLSYIGHYLNEHFHQTVITFKARSIQVLTGQVSHLIQ